MLLHERQTLTIQINGVNIKRYNGMRPSECACTVADLKQRLKDPKDTLPSGDYCLIVRGTKSKVLAKFSYRRTRED